GRAREAGEVNKSLLTLGRVITSLAEHSSHIPYRDSKLTRLLRESLGGRAKTCIIATISPSAHSLEETLNTLDYACRAKSIRNKPEANKKFSKSVLLKDLFLEIEKLKQDVRAAREKNGIYIPQERFLQDEVAKKATHEKLDVLEFDLDHARKQADRFQELYHAEQERNLDLESKLKECKTNLEENKKACLELQEVLMRSNLMLKEREYIISNLLDSERQSQIEAKNHGLVVDFGSELDQSLKTLHRMVIGSICENHESLKSMEEYVSSFVAAKCEAAKCLDLKHERLKSIYSYGILRMKELSGVLQHKAFSDLEETRSTMFAQMIAVENFLVTAASEAEQVLHDIQISLSDQKDLLDFFVQQQATGLQRNLVSTEAISKTTIHFFHELQRQVSKLLKNLEHDQLEKSRRLAAFEKNFVDLSAREDKAAFEKISLIFTNLMKLKVQMVSEVLGNVNDTNAEDSRRQQVEVVNMQLTSDNAKKSWINYIERVESQFQEDAASITRIRMTMDNIFQNCSIKVGQSLHHWKNIQSTIDHMHKDSTAEVDCFVVSRNQERKNIFEEFTSVVSENNVQFDSETGDLQAAAKMSVVLDHEVMEHIESASTKCFYHLTTLQDSHSENVKDIRCLADKCFLREYKADNPTSLTPTKRSLNVPSLASIEELRTRLEDPIKNDRRDSKLREAEEKQHVCGAMPTPRSPLTPINSL
ncbi:KISc, partial [Musa troglodytarum]